MKVKLTVFLFLFSISTILTASTQYVTLNCKRDDYPKVSFHSRLSTKRLVMSDLDFSLKDTPIYFAQSYSFPLSSNMEQGHSTVYSFIDELEQLGIWMPDNLKDFVEMGGDFNAWIMLNGSQKRKIDSEYIEVFCTI